MKLGLLHWAMKPGIWGLLEKREFANYSRPSVAGTLMARLPWLVRTRS